MESLDIQPYLPQPPAPAMATSQAHEVSSIQSPQVIEQSQDDNPTANSIPGATTILPVGEVSTLQSSESTTLNHNNLLIASTDEVCQWLSRHDISTTSLDILRREEIDGRSIFLLSESFDRICKLFKEEGMKLGQISKIFLAIEKAKAEGAFD
mmetsp:Transcript_3214/g.4333  ORF Transcript_3214/g.4333 Transcript_3214/m.4333 type:complete len:153 (-) Transcript_3214:114-572(-)